MTLPDRVLHHLNDRGPDYTSHIAESLGVRTAAVAGAITSLKKSGLVELHEIAHSGTGGHPRFYYRAMGLRPARARARSTTERPPACYYADVDYLERLEDEAKLLRLEQRIATGEVDADVLWAVYENHCLV